MDPNTAQDQTQKPPKSLISLEDAQAVFTELGLQDLPDDKKSTMLETMIDTVMDRIFQRIEPTLTENDKKMLSDLEMRPNADEAMASYLVGVVPNLDSIAMEEIRNYKQELKQQISTIIDIYDEEAGKQDNQVPPQESITQGVIPQDITNTEDVVNTVAPSQPAMPLDNAPEQVAFDNNWDNQQDERVGENVNGASNTITEQSMPPITSNSQDNNTAEIPQPAPQNPGFNS